MTDFAVLKTSGGFPVAVAALDARALGKPCGEFTFGLDRDNLVASLRRFADDIEAGAILPQSAGVNHTASVEDFTLSELTIRYAVKTGSLTAPRWYHR